MAPKHIGIILDGNGRWAARQGKERTEGYAAGVRTLYTVIDFCKSQKIGHLTVFAFSTENQKRPEDERRAIFAAVSSFLENPPEGCAINFLGGADNLGNELSETVLKAQKDRPKNAKINLNIALNYGGRADIVNAANKIAADAKNTVIKKIDEQTFSKYLSTANLPPLDLIIRTGGHKRLSNFMLFEAAYSELIFLDTLFPDLTISDMRSAINEYKNRNRNFGA